MKILFHSIIRAAAVAALLLTSVSCGKSRIIPDSTLSQIFYEAFLTNAFVADRRVQTDSLALYEPLLARYGYTPEDLQYTIGNFSKRKSARLGNVVEVAISRLESEGSIFDREVAILDTIDARARRKYSRTLYSDTLVKVWKMRDTTLLRIVIDSMQRGDYEVSFRYNIDSLDKNVRQRVMIRTERTDSTEHVELNNILQRQADRRIVHTVKNDGSMRRLNIQLARFDNASKVESPHMTFRDVTVRYVPYADDVRDSLYEQTINLGIFNMQLLEEHSATDSLTQTAVAR